jgi:hypothetical protein
MVAIRVSAIVGKDRQITVQLPDEVPEGQVELEVRVLEAPVNPERERIRTKLMAAGFLVNPDDLGIPEDAVPLSVEERLRLGELPPDAVPTHILIDEDRGPR